MNRYLEKIAEITSLPYRPRAEIVIVHPKTNKVLVTQHYKEGHSWKGLPGGGIEEGESVIDAAVKEALEEVGVAVKNPVEMNISSVQHGYVSTKHGRNKKFGGFVTQMVKATYDGKDDSLFGNDNDSVKYVWMEPHKALAEFEKGKSLGGTHRPDAMRALIKSRE